MKGHAFSSIEYEDDRFPGVGLAVEECDRCGLEMPNGFDHLDSYVEELEPCRPPWSVLVVELFEKILANRLAAVPRCWRTETEA